MKTTLPLFILIFFCNFLIGQSEEFSLRDYKTTDLKRQTLEFDGGYSNIIGGGQFNTGGTSTPKDKNQQFGLDGGTVYRFFLNNRKIQRDVFGSFQGGLSRIKLVPTTAPIEKTFNGFGEFEFSSLNRNYSKKQKFLEYNGTLFTSATFNTEEIDEVKTELKRLSPKVNLQIGVGKGRVENVTTAHRAMFLIKALKKENLIDDSTNSEDVTKIADLINVLENDRFFDRRIKRIYQIAQLDAMFVNSGVLNESSALATAIIYDQWFSTNFINRLSGKRFSFGLTGGTQLDWQTIDFPAVNFFNDRKNSSSEVGGYLAYSYHLPVNLHWQHNFSAQLSVLNRWSKEVDISLGQRKTNAEVDFSTSYSLSWYPNTRTDITGTLMTELTSGDNGFFTNDISSALQGSARINANYYFSPRVRLSGNIGYSSFRNNFTSAVPLADADSQSWFFSNSFGFSYFLF